MNIAIVGYTPFLDTPKEEPLCFLHLDLDSDLWLQAPQQDSDELDEYEEAVAIPAGLGEFTLSGW